VAHPLAHAALDEGGCYLLSLPFEVGYLVFKGLLNRFIVGLCQQSFELRDFPVDGCEGVAHWVLLWLVPLSIQAA
jgi:hypothetical protein